MARVLACGVATIDLVQVVGEYPAADDEIRADKQFLWRGGNATNTLVVLSQLGHDCSWLGSLAGDDFAAVICADLDRHNIDYRYCPRYSNAVTPTSHVTLSQANASRCIVHYRDLPELSEDDGRAIDFSAYDWLHVEGRNIEVTRTLLQYVRKQFPGLSVSLEIEKPREDIESLLTYADYVLFSTHYARAKGYFTPEKLLKAFAAEQQNRIHVCSWGDEGATCRTPAGEMLHVPAAPVGKVVDTRAAGDVFNAAWINAMLQGHDLQQCLQEACSLAGRKCTRFGIDGLVE